MRSLKREKQARLYTADQIEQIRREARESYKEICLNELKKHKKEIEDQTIMLALSLALAVPARVLIEEFKWSVNTRKDSKVGRFVMMSADKINDILTNSTSKKNIATYCKETFDMYGIQYKGLYDDIEEE